MATTGAEEEGHNEGERDLASIQFKRPFFSVNSFSFFWFFSSTMSLI